MGSLKKAKYDVGR